MSDFGPAILPESIKNSSLDMYWIKQFSNRYKAKVTLNKYYSGELDGSRLTPNNYRRLLLAVGETEKKADVAAAKLHLDQKRNS